jgi:hypothetical protein
MVPIRERMEKHKKSAQLAGGAQDHRRTADK